jgi:hypothetical protein
MSETTSLAASQARPRLKFIDMARSFAILLMLEGHFTGAALADEYRSSEYWLYNVWHNLHGLTSPLFFTVTGLIFVYLLSANNEINYLDNIRVKKGYRRVRDLLFWGYLIQLNIWSISKSFYYGSKFYMEWFYAFHVLQSIGVGIFFLLLIYGVYKWFNKGSLHWYYLTFAVIMLIIYAWLKNYMQIDATIVAEGLREKPAYLPQGAPSIVQNMIYGRYSDFGFVRYSGYVLLGGMLGALIRKYEQQAREWWFGLAFIAVCLLLNIFIQPFLHYLDKIIEATGLVSDSLLELNTTTIRRFGQVLGVLGALMLIDKYFNVKSGLFLKIGQNTLPIYVVHVIILYGGIFGFGLKPLLFDQNLHPAYAAGVSVFFMIFFSFMVKHIEPLERIYSLVKGKVTFWIPKDN